jgi:predicted HTH domain antitoxin
MSITITIPEKIAQHLEQEWGDLSRRALEALAVEGYRSEALSAGQVAEMLNLSRMEVEEFLKERNVYLNYTLEDLEKDRKTYERLFGK